MSKKVVVLGLDGVPYTFLTKLFSEGKMPYLKQLVDQGTFCQLDSSYPPVSSAAWATFMTGKNPGGHNIYGFVDKTTTNTLYIPTSKDMTSQTLWEHSSAHEKKVVVINVPVTYPPRTVNGTLIAGFLCPTVEELTNNTAILPVLKEIGYKIDADATLVMQGKQKLLDEIKDVFEKRKKTLFTLMKQEPWDFFMCHIMETDRLNHFFWGEMEEKNEEFYQQYMDFMQQIDSLVKEVHEQLDADTELVLLSDHGFCSIKSEYEMNKALQDAGFLTLKEDHEQHQGLLKIDMEKTKAYSLIPGRFYIVDKANSGKIKAELKLFLENLTDPEDGAKIIQTIKFREEIYSGRSIENAPDLVAIPVDGYDLKAHFGVTQLKVKGHMTGMHTFNNCFFLTASKQEIKKQQGNLADVMPTVLKLMDLDKPQDLVGESII